MVRLKYRKISPYFWNDGKVKALSEKAQFLMLFMLTHEHMTPLGAISANMPGLAYERGWLLEVFTEAFKEVQEQGMVKYDDDGPLFWFPNFLKHNPPESPNVIRSWVGGWWALPECDLKNELLEQAACRVAGLSGGFQKAFREAFGVECGHPMPNQEQEQEQEQEEEKNASGEASAPPEGGAGGDPASEPTASTREEEPGTQSEDVEQGGKVPPCPYTKLVAEYNAVLGGVLPQVREITEKRKRTMRARWTSHPERQALQWWREYFGQVKRSPFLTGQKNNFRASFDWITNPGNMVKILEGNYDEKPGKGQGGALGGPGASTKAEFSKLMEED